MPPFILDAGSAEAVAVGAGVGAGVGVAVGAGAVVGLAAGTVVGTTAAGEVGPAVGAVTVPSVGCSDVAESSPHAARAAAAKAITSARQSTFFNSGPLDPTGPSLSI